MGFSGCDFAIYLKWQYTWKTKDLVVHVFRERLPEVLGQGLEFIKAVVKSSLKAISLESRRWNSAQKSRR